MPISKFSKCFQVLQFLHHGNETYWCPFQKPHVQSDKVIWLVSQWNSIFCKSYAKVVHVFVDFHSKNRYTGLAELVKQVEKVPIILKSWRFSQAFRKKKFWRLDKNWLNYTQISILLKSSCKICKIRNKLDKFNQSLTSFIKVWHVLTNFQLILTNSNQFWQV